VLLETAPEGLPSLREQVQALTQIRHNSPLWRRGGAELDAALEPINRWIEARDQAPAWDGDQVATLALCLEMARE
jgi:hypothetical protein